MNKANHYINPVKSPMSIEKLLMFLYVFSEL